MEPTTIAEQTINEFNGLVDCESDETMRAAAAEIIATLDAMVEELDQ